MNRGQQDILRTRTGIYKRWEGRLLLAEAQLATVAQEIRFSTLNATTLFDVDAALRGTRSARLGIQQQRELVERESGLVDDGQITSEEDWW